MIEVSDNHDFSLYVKMCEPNFLSYLLKNIIDSEYNYISKTENMKNSSYDYSTDDYVNMCVSDANSDSDSSAFSSLLIGFYNEFSLDSKVDLDLAITYYYKCFRKLYDDACKKLFVHDFLNNSMLSNPRKYIKEQITQAKAGDVDCMMNLASIYSKPNGINRVKSNNKLSLKWFTEACHKENLIAKYNVASYHIFGVGCRTNKNNQKKGIESYSNMTTIPGIRSFIFFNYGIMYYNGYIFDKDYLKAVSFMRKAVLCLFDDRALCTLIPSAERILEIWLKKGNKNLSPSDIEYVRTIIQDTKNLF